MLRILTLIAVLIAGAAQATDGTPEDKKLEDGKPENRKLGIELNSIALRNDSCEVYLRVRNDTTTGFSTFKVDLAFFDRTGIINDRSLVELGPLRANKTSLHVFQMPEMDCNDVGEVLLNDVTECTPTDPAADIGDCLNLVTLSSKGDIAFVR